MLPLSRRGYGVAVRQLLPHYCSGCAPNVIVARWCQYSRCVSAAPAVGRPVHSSAPVTSSWAGSARWCSTDGGGGASSETTASKDAEQFTAESPLVLYGSKNPKFVRGAAAVLSTQAVACLPVAAYFYSTDLAPSVRTFEGLSMLETVNEALSLAVSQARHTGLYWGVDHLFYSIVLTRRPVAVHDCLRGCKLASPSRWWPPSRSLQAIASLTLSSRA